MYYHSHPGKVVHGARVCVFLTLNRFFLPVDIRTTSVRADSSILGEVHVM